MLLILIGKTRITFTIFGLLSFLESGVFGLLPLAAEPQRSNYDKPARIIGDYEFETSDERRLVFIKNKPAYFLPPLLLLPSFDTNWNKLNYGDLRFLQNKIRVYATPGGGSDIPPPDYFYKIENQQAFISKDGISFHPLNISVLKRQKKIPRGQPFSGYMRWYQLRVQCVFFDHVFELATDMSPPVMDGH